MIACIALPYSKACDDNQDKKYAQTNPSPHTLIQAEKEKLSNSAKKLTAAAQYES
jgi:hypothetical protein